MPPKMDKLQKLSTVKTKETQEVKKPEEQVRIWMNGREQIFNLTKLAKILGVDSFIRIPDDEFENINERREFLGHFNLKRSDHRVGDKYAIVKIKKHGSPARDGQDEIPPLLSLDGAYIAECVEFKNDLSYDNLDKNKKYFKYSMDGVGDTLELRDAMVRRYKLSRNFGSVTEILNQGVGFTLLKITGRLNTDKLKK